MADLELFLVRAGEWPGDDYDVHEGTHDVLERAALAGTGGIPAGTVVIVTGVPRSSTFNQ